MRLVLIVAQSLDGFITRHDDPGVAWASAADQKWFRSCLSEFDCSVTGRATYEVIRDVVLAAKPNGRRRIVMTRQPERFSADIRPGLLEFSAAEPPSIVASLAASGGKNCAVLGGAQVHDAFLHAGLVDEIWTTIEPRIFGQGTPLVGRRHDLSLTLRDHQRLPDSDSIVLRYTVQR
ncbi:dihydrofolate reductase family protein [Synoicihabitans lomoniglobus]|uniref:Dihydrofolate reductase family protein n=1 Tax=Synoicihabitans lomoniglobus TaxID=2909285 RepID=A0AAE9ZSM8_9BACT|nr:dihydrofolate reductase family protein [Opitutaceae bacterium LMO-M01]WED63432.1 dihydrofolate reductase family protein [Opitutaceae bacterium LMO-M01]